MAIESLPGLLDRLHKGLDDIDAKAVEELRSAFANEAGRVLKWPRNQFIIAQALCEDQLGTYVAETGDKAHRFFYATPNPLTPIKKMEQADGFDATHSLVSADTTEKMRQRANVVHANLIERRVPTDLLIDLSSLDSFVYTAGESSEAKSTVDRALKNIGHVLRSAGETANWAVSIQPDFEHSCAILVFPDGTTVQFTGPQADAAPKERDLLRIITGPQAEEELARIKEAHAQAVAEGFNNNFLKRKVEKQRSKEVIEFLETLPRGARVVLALPNSYLLADCITYCFENDLVAVPLDPRLPEEKKRFIIEHSEAHALVDQNTMDAELGTAHDYSGAFLLIYTSGSTGDPKGVLLNKSAVVENAREVGKLHGFDKGHNHATCLPLFHCNALCMSLVGSLVFDQPFHLLEKFSVDGYMDLIRKNNIRTASIVPPLLERIVQEAPELPDCLEYFITAAAPLTSDLAGRFFELYGTKLVQGYGLSESVNFSFVMPKLSEEEFVEQYIRNQPPVGLPVPGSDMRLEDGEVLVKSGCLMSGYLKNEAATEEAFTPDGYLRTGDLGHFRDGFLVLSGRKKDVINRGGETIYPKDVEEEWRKIGLSGLYVSFGVSNNILSDDIGIWIESDDYGQLLTKFQNSFYRPSLVQTGEILRTSVYKPQRRKMRETLVTRSINLNMYQALSDRCRKIAKTIVASFILSEVEGRHNYIYQAAKAFLNAAPVYGGTVRLPEEVSASLDAFESFLPFLMSGSLMGDDLMRENRGLWRSIMMGFPMGEYAKLCADFLMRGDRLAGRVLELGSGVGNTSNQIIDVAGDSYIRSDLGRDLNPGFGKGSYMSLDFNQPLGVDDIDLVVSTNALHCANDKGKTLKHIFDALVEGGTIVFAEGAPNTHNRIPWALSAFYGMFDGWWNVGGFIERSEWVRHLDEAGFRNIGWSILRAGHHDLGGLIWAKK